MNKETKKIIIEKLNSIEYRLDKLLEIPKEEIEKDKRRKWDILLRMILNNEPNMNTIARIACFTIREVIVIRDYLAKEIVLSSRNKIK